MANNSYPNQITNPKAAAPFWDAGGTYYHTAATTTGYQVKAGLGTLQRLNINSAWTTGVLTAYDGTSTGGALIGVYTMDAQGNVDIGAQFLTGLFIVITGTPGDSTIIYH